MCIFCCMVNDSGPLGATEKPWFLSSLFCLTQNLNAFCVFLRLSFGYYLIIFLFCRGMSDHKQRNLIQMLMWVMSCNQATLILRRLVDKVRSQEWQVFFMSLECCITGMCLESLHKPLTRDSCPQACFKAELNPLNM